MSWPATPRDRRALLLGAMTLGFLLLIFQAVLPLTERFQRLRQGSVRREMALQEMRQLVAEHAVLSRQGQSVAARLAARPANLSLFSVLDQATIAAGVREQVVSLAPSGMGDGTEGEQRAEIRLRGIALGQLVDLLSRIEQPALVVGIRRLQVQVDSGGSLDVTLEAVTLNSPKPGP